MKFIMTYFPKSCVIFLFLSIGGAKCNVPGIEEALELAKQASLGISIEAVDQDINILYNNFNDICRIKLSTEELESIRSKMNKINEHVYNVNEAYEKFKEINKNHSKSVSNIQNTVKHIWNNNTPANEVQGIYEEIMDVSDPVVIATLGHDKNASYLFGLLYEIIVYTEIKYLAIQLYFYDISTGNEKDCAAEIAKDRVKFRLTNTLNNMNKALDRVKRNYGF